MTQINPRPVEMIKEALWVGWDGMGWMGFGWLSLVLGSVRAPSVLIMTSMRYVEEK